LTSRLCSERHGKIWFGGLANDAAHHALMKFVRAGANGDVPADLLPLRFVPSPNSQEMESRCAFRRIPVAGSWGWGVEWGWGIGAI
jgi:hypothetical protein